MRVRRGPHVTELAELGAGEWDTTLAESGLPFRFSHRAAAGQALGRMYESYRFTPLRVEYDDGVVLLLPLVRVTRRIAPLSMALALPLGLEGRPLALAGTPGPGHLEALFDALDGCGRLDVAGGAGGSPPAAGEVSLQTTHVLDLSPGFEELWAHAFGAKTRNMCRKAERGGVTVTPESRPEAVAVYQSLYRASALGWGYSVPPYPDALFAALLSNEHAELWLARAGHEAVAGAVMLRGSEDLLYWSGAMNREFRHLAPSNAIIRAVVEDACRRGIAYLDFGSSAGISGVETFKRSFGAQEREYRTVSLTTLRYRQLERARRAAGRLGAGAAA